LTHGHAEARAPARVVVLGAGGFVGHELVAHLRAKGTALLALGRGELDLAAEPAGEQLAAVLRNDDTLVFLSALTPDKGRGIPPFLANLRMGAAVCAALERSPVAHVIYLGSDAVYPFREGLVSEQSCAEPTDLYGAMHLAREIMVKQATKAPVAVLRPTLIYGVGDTHNSYGPNRFRRAARKDKRIALFGEGEETRDHILIGDVVRLIDRVIGHRSAGLLNLATGNSIAYADLAKSVAALFAEPVEVAGTPRQNPVTHRHFDITAMRRAFPDFAFTPLARGIEEVHRQDSAAAG
jgi:nucleoside-diphosphate-sugar epimerase